MAVTTPPSLTPAPTPAPQRNDRTTFSSRVDAFVTWLITAVTEFSNVANNVALNATDAATSASTASTQAGNASTYATNASNSADAAASSASTAAGFTSTSTSSFTIGTGSKIFTTQSSKQYTVGVWVTITGVVPTNYMFGQVTSYSGTSLTVNVTSTGGSGTLSAWTISLAGIAGPAGGVSSLNGQTGNLVNFADLNTAQTLSNKTFVTPVIGTPVSGDLSNCTVAGTYKLGYINIPQNTQSSAYTAVLLDAGKHLLHPTADTTARTFTIPANSSVAYDIGTAITFVNQTGAGVLTIAITTDTMRLAGLGTTGSRTLAANGIATAIKLTATEWLISGTNLT